MNTTFRILLPAAIGACLLGSCKKETTNPASPTPMPTPVFESPSAYFKSDAGDYWIYAAVSIDTNGVETPFGGTDSIYVAPDTVINGNTYHTYRGTWYSAPQTIHWRDSSYCIVNEAGRKLFTTQLFDQPLDSTSYPGIYYAYYSVPSAAASITVPAGTFSSLDFLGETHMTTPNYPWAPVRYTHMNYVNSIGLVREQKFYSSSPGVIERRLVRYHVN